LLLLKVGVLSIVPLGISTLQYRFVVGGYLHKCVTLRISKGVRAVPLAARISRSVYSDTRVIYIIIIALYIMLAEKIGTPLIILVSDSIVSSVSIHKSIPVICFCFRPIQKKPQKTLGFIVCHNLDCIEFKFLVVGRLPFAFPIFSILSCQV
jgi:hypothetical protein